MNPVTKMRPYLLTATSTARSSAPALPLVVLTQQRQPSGSYLSTNQSSWPPLSNQPTTMRLPSGSVATPATISLMSVPRLHERIHARVPSGWYFATITS